MTYASVTVLVNLTNSYDKQEVSAEMMELAKFAKQHIPQEHVKVKPHDHFFFFLIIEKMERKE